MVGADDQALVARASEGDVEAFAEIVRRYESRVRIVLLRLLDDARDVEEATQDCFVQAWRNLDRFRGESAVFTALPDRGERGAGAPAPEAGADHANRRKSSATSGRGKERA